MQRGFVLALAAALSACAPAPVEMPAAQAAEVLNLFAAGRGPADVCSADGRAVLRGAVRAYAHEMNRSGVDWPIVPGAVGETANVTAMDVSVMIAFAAGFVKTSDFRHPARGFMTQLTLAEWPEIQDMRRAARNACQEVAALQQAAAAFVVESTRYSQMTSRERNGASEADRLRRQSLRMQRAQTRMQETAAVVQARMQERNL